MMEKTNVESLFEWLDTTTEIIQQHENEPYLDCLTITMETLFYQDVADEIDDLLSYKLQTALKTIDVPAYKTEDVRKAVQLAILKGMKDSTQQQHLMTPETVALFVGYLAGKLTKDKDAVRIFD